MWMWREFCLYVFVVQISSVLGKILPITTVHWKDVDAAFKKYAQRQPFLIKHTPSARWQITDYLRTHSIKQGNARVASYYQRRSDMSEMDIEFTYTSTRVREINCTCFMPDISRSKCQQYVHEIPYRSKGHQLKFWLPYESNYAEIQQLEACSNLSTIESMNMDTLFSLIRDIDLDHEHQRDTPIHRSLYSTGDVPLQLYRDLNHFQPFFKTFNVNGANARWENSIWIATQFTSPSRHYDSTNNLFFVLRGCKQFLLSPPSLSAFPLYPALHPGWRQEMMNSANQNSKHSENADIADDILIYDAKLDASSGDVLYIPPFWLHKVHNLCANTIAVNAWYSLAKNEHTNPLSNLFIPAMPAYLDGMIDIYKLVDEILFFMHYFLPTFEENALYYSIGNAYLQTYPVLFDIRQMVTGTNGMEWKWLQLFIDVENMQKCMDQLSIQLLLTRTYQCFASDIAMNEWNKYIQRLRTILTQISSGEKVSKIVMTEYIERIWQDIVMHGDQDQDIDVLTIVPLLLASSGLN